MKKNGIKNQAQIVTIANRRGGSGKTATAHALGVGLMLRGKRVLFVDLDSQENLTFDLRGVPDEDEDALRVMMGQRKASEAVQRTGSGADLIPASERLSLSDAVLQSPGREYLLRDALKEVRESYDWIVIDTPPSLGMLTVAALTASDQVLITAQAEIHSLHGCSKLMQSVGAIQRVNPQLKISGILLTRYNSRTVIARDMRINFEEMASRAGTKVYQTVIRECNAVKEAQALQMDLWRYAPRSNAAKDYQSMIREFLGEI